jgi:hypothetical protein
MKNRRCYFNEGGRMENTRETTLFIWRFVSGHATVKGHFSFVYPPSYSGYNLKYPFMYSGLTAKLTDKRMLITFMRITIWEVALSDISSIKIKPYFLGGAISIESDKNDKGFFLLVRNISNLVETLKKLNLPVQCDEKSLQQEKNRFNLFSNPVVLTIAMIFGIAFIIFIIYNIFQSISPK